jgi:hypothetical protein
MTMSVALPTLIAFGGDRWGPGGGWGWLCGPLVLLLWVALIATVVWFLARGTRPPDRSGID